MKYCPTCNRLFSDAEKVCPFDNTDLIVKESPDNRYQNMKKSIDDLHVAIQTTDSRTPETANSHAAPSPSIDIQEIQPVDISPEKIQEIRNQMFVDSNSVWFDPYSSPDQNKKREENLKPETQSAIIISTEEKATDLHVQRNYYPADEEIQLVSESEKVAEQIKPPSPKHTPPITDRYSATKRPALLVQKNIENILTRKNIMIGVAIALAFTLIISFTIYKLATSGIGKIDKNVEFNLPLPSGPPPVINQNERLTEEGSISKPEDSRADRHIRQKATRPRNVKTHKSRSKSTKVNYLEYYRQANKYFKERKYDMAAKYYKYAIRSKPDFAMAYRGLGDSYARLGKFELSIKQYEKYIELDPNGPDVDKVIQIINEYRSKKNK